MRAARATNEYTKLTPYSEHRTSLPTRIFFFFHQVLTSYARYARGMYIGTATFFNW